MDICLEGWIADGIVEMRASEQTPRVAPKREENKPAIPGVIDESEIDPSLELSVEDQRKILEFESGLGRGYAEILGVKSDADVKVIKKAYRKLSDDRLHRTGRVDIHVVLLDGSGRAIGPKWKVVGPLQ